MIPKTKTMKKSVRMRASTTHGHGARKRWKGKGRKGGKGMAGTGKRADHKKTLMNKLYGNKYFGRQGITSKSTKRKKVKIINLKDINERFDKQANLKDYKILGEGDIDKAVTITAKAFTKSAKDKIEKAGGKCIVPTKSNTSISDKTSSKQNNSKGEKIVKNIDKVKKQEKKEVKEIKNNK